MSKIVWVVTEWCFSGKEDKLDYSLPDQVFLTKEAAEQYIAEKKRSWQDPEEGTVYNMEYDAMPVTMEEK